MGLKPFGDLPANITRGADLDPGGVISPFPDQHCAEYMLSHDASLHVEYTDKQNVFHSELVLPVPLTVGAENKHLKDGPAT